MIGGIDLGGTKIAAGLFSDQGDLLAEQTIPTPTENYDALLDAVLAQVQWLESRGETTVIGLGSPGLVHPATGRVLAANIPVNGQQLGLDISARAHRSIALIKDCQAFTLAEATVGAGKDHAHVLGLIIGTGVAAGQARNGRPITGATGQSGEYGHLTLSARVTEPLSLPLLTCGCGRVGCFETYLAGPGLTALAQHMTGQNIAPEIIMQDPAFENIRDVWLDILTELIATIMLTTDPAQIVLGGGVGSLPWLPDALTPVLKGKLLKATKAPSIATALYPKTSGALGAALYAAALHKEG
jgi:N-acetylglucosamine kinase